MLIFSLLRKLCSAEEDKANHELEVTFICEHIIRQFRVCFA